MATTNAQQHDIGAYLAPFPALDGATITAGAGNDNTEINGNVLDRLAVPPSPNGPAESCMVVIPFRATLAAAATLSMTANMQDDTAVGMATAQADYPIRRARVFLSTGAVTDLTLNAAGALPATVIATGPGGGGTVKGCVALDVDLSSARQYIRLQRTLDLSASGTDTVADSAIIVLGGLYARMADGH